MNRGLTVPALLVAALTACGGEVPTTPAVPPPFDPEQVARILHLSPLPPLPADPTNAVADDVRAARLGQRLFFDTRLSRDGDRACASCHHPEQAFTDGLPVAVGLLPLERHTPTLINCAYQRWLFWDGRADSLWAQALVPFESPLEHAASRLLVAHVIADDPLLRSEYEELFGPLPPLGDRERFPPSGRPVPRDDHAHILAAQHAAQSREKRPGIYGGHTHPAGGHFYHPHQRAWDGMTPEDREAATAVYVHVGKCIAAYERRLIAGRAPFDRFVEGLREHDEEKIAALSPAARRGLALFLGKARCHLCHSGPLFSDLEFHDIGLDGSDPGRSRGIEALRRSEFLGTGPWSDAPEGPAGLKIRNLPAHRHGGMEFKTPSLRNVAATAPYMHDGRFASLEEVIDFYSTRAGTRSDPPTTETILQPLHLGDDEKADLLAFLRSLTDLELPAELTHAPSY